MTPGLVSVVIPAKDSAATLELCLHALARQTYKAVEVIVVDNGSSDETMAIAQRWGVEVSSADGRIPSGRNRGSRQSSGEFLLHIDSDMELPPDSIAQCVSCARRGAGIVILPERNVAQGYWMRAYSFGKELARGVEGMEYGRFVSAALFHAIGGYDENLLSGEDRDFFLRCLASGATTASIEAITLHHVEYLTIRDIFHKTARYARTRERFVQKQGVADKKALLTLIVRGWPVMARSPLIAVGWLMFTAAVVIRDAILLSSVKRSYSCQQAEDAGTMPN